MKKRILTSKELESIWDSYSEFYSRLISPNKLHMSLCMAQICDLSKKNSILEVGTGEGLLGVELALRKPLNANLYLTDISEEMCRYTSTRIQILNKGLLKCDQELIRSALEPLSDDSITFEVEKDFKELNTKILKTDSQELPTEIGTSTIDLYISSLVLHLVPDPSKMLSEAFKVLKPGGEIILSIGSNFEGSTFFNAAPKAISRLGIKRNESRDGWHLSDKKSLLRLLEEAGFSNIVIWEQFVPMKRFPEEELQEIATRFAGVHDNKEREHCIQKHIIEQFSDEWKCKQTPIGFYVLISRATKL